MFHFYTNQCHVPLVYHSLIVTIQTLFFFLIKNEVCIQLLNKKVEKNTNYSA